MAVRGENSLFFASGIDNTGLQRGTLDAVGMVQGMADSIAKINPFMALAAGATAAFAAIAHDAYKMMRDFQTAMNEVKTIANVSEAEFKALEDQVFSLYKRLGTETPDELARGLYDIIGSGYEAADALILLEAASKAATAGVTTSAVASDGLTTILNSFRMGVEDATRVADIMFATVDIGKISFEELATQIAQVAPLAAASGFSFEEIGGAISTLTKQGVPASQAMTQIRSAIVATNEVLGDGVAETMTLQNAFQELYNQAGGSQNELKNLVGRIEAVNGILSIAGPNFEGATQDLLHMADAAGSVDRAFETVTSGEARAWEIFGQRIKSTTREIGEVILQMSGSVVTALNKAFESSEDLRKGYEDQKLELFKLEGALHNVTQGSEAFNDIRDEIMRNYPEFIGGIDTEKVTTEELLSVLNKVNDAYVQRFKFAQREAELREAYERQGMLEINIEDAAESFERTIAEIRSKYPSIELDLSLDDEQLYEQVREQTASIVGVIGQQTEGQQVLQGQIYRLKSLIDTQKEYREELEEQRRIVDEIAERNQRYSKADLQTDQGRLEAIRKINEATRESELSQFVDSGVDEIERALQARRDILSNLRKIDQTQSLEELKSYLESENEEVAKAAKRRARILNTDYTPQNGGDSNDAETYAQMLKNRERQYQEYTAAVNQLGKDQADEMYQELLKQGDNYGDYLQRQLNQTSDAAKRTAIAVAAELNKINLRRGDVSSVNELTAQGIVDFEVNDTSINYIERQISRLREQWKAASEEERPDIQPHLEYWEERLRIAEQGAEEEKSINEQIRLELKDLSHKGLIDYRNEWQEKLKVAKAVGNELAAIDAKARIDAANNQIAENTGDTIRDVTRTLGDASSMFRKFGDEDLANVLDKLSSVGSGIASIVQGITTGGPLGMFQVLGGMFGALGSMAGGGGTPQRSELERSISELDKSVNRLRKSFGFIYGAEAIKERKESVENLKEQIRLEIDALSYAEAAYKAYGRGMGNFSIPQIGFQGNGADIELWIENKKAEIDDLRLQLQSLERDNMEWFTGRTSENITDSIIQGLRDGKKGIEDFAGTFEEIMQDAILRTFQTQFLESRMNEFYEEFAARGEDGEYSASDIADLQKLWNEITSKFGDEIDLMNGILEGAGLDPIGFDAERRREGLSGAISSITEDTANILAGTLNAMMLDIRQGLDIAIASSEHLANIDRYTSHLPMMGETMRSIDGRLSTIERGFQESQANS